MPQIVTSIREDLVTVRTHNRIMGDLMRETIYGHRDKTLQEHFRPGNAQRYHMERRSQRWQKYKLKHYGTNIDLVATGETQRMLAAVLPTSTKDRGRIRARTHFPLTDKRRQEIEVVLVSERGDIVKFINKEYVRRAMLPGNRRRRMRRSH